MKERGYVEMGHNWRIPDAVLCVMCMFVTCSGNLPVAVVCEFIPNSLKLGCSGSDGMTRDKAREEQQELAARPVSGGGRPIKFSLPPPANLQCAHWKPQKPTH